MKTKVLYRICPSCRRKSFQRLYRCRGCGRVVKNGLRAGMMGVMLKCRVNRSVVGIRCRVQKWDKDPWGGYGRRPRRYGSSRLLCGRCLRRIVASIPKVVKIAKYMGNSR